MIGPIRMNSNSIEICESDAVQLFVWVIYVATSVSSAQTMR